MRLIRYIPAAIDWDEIQLRYPFPKHVREDQLNYFLGYLTNRIVFDRDIKTGDAIPVHSKTMIKILTKYAAIKDYLTDIGIIKTTGQYIPGFQSKSYSFTEHYSGPLQRVEINDFLVKQRHKKFKESILCNSNTKNDFLKKFFSERLTIDLHSVFVQCNPILEEAPHWYDEDKTKMHAMLQSASMIHYKEYYFATDTTSGRLHTNLSNFRSEGRGFLQYDNQQLGCCDLSNSQPYLLGGFLNAKLYTDENSFLNHCLENCSEEIRNKIKKSLQKLREVLNVGSDLNDYVALVESGKFYEFFQTELNNRLRKLEIPEVTSRRIIKVEVLTVFYCENWRNGDGYYRKYLKEIFKQFFPTVYQTIYIMKKEAYNTFSIMLQAIERELIIGVVAKECVELGMDPVFTIHDSVVSTINNLSQIHEIMNSTLSDFTGIIPCIKVEKWEPKPLFKQ